MTEKEIAEIRRRFNIEKTDISCVRGCYVNENREIISDFSQFFGTVARDEAEELLAIIKKTLSGTLGKNLIDIEFSNQQVIGSPEHDLLMALKNSEIKDDGAARALYDQIIQSLNIEGKYLILLTCDKYDVPSYSKDDVKLEDMSEVFTYIVCSICPVKMTKPALSYRVNENEFRNIDQNWIISAPELGFMFPSFDDRQSNIYNAVYYVKNSAENYEEFAEAVFNSSIPMPADAQKEIFNSILEDSVSEECSFDVMQNVHAQISDMMEEYKSGNSEEPPVISKRTVTDVLEYCGVTESKIEEFSEKYDDEFGADVKLSPKNIIDVKKFEMKTSDVSIKVNPERLDLVKTQVINGQKYILIRVDEGVEVNGVNIKITDES